jgi:hypothetical protein
MEQLGELLLHILSLLARIDLDVTVTKLYIHISLFRDILSDHDTIRYFQQKLGILVGKKINFPLLCVHLSVLKPLTSRIPLRVCLLLNVRYNYHLTDIPAYPIYCSTFMRDCCATTSGTGGRILGTERTLAFTTGRVSKYVRGIIICLAQGGYYDSIVSLIDKYCNGTLKYDSVDMENMLKEHMEVLVTSVPSFNQSLSSFNVLSKILSGNPYSAEVSAFMSMMYFYDRVEDIKHLVLKKIITVEYIKSTFNCLSSTQLFGWLYRYHNYGMSDITSHCYPYGGSMLYSLKQLFKHADVCGTVDINDEIVIAVIMSDDIESLIWLGDKGIFMHKDYTYLRTSGITKEKLTEFSLQQKSDNCCVC